MKKNTNNIDEIYLQGQKAFYALREEAQTSGCAECLLMRLTK